MPQMEAVLPLPEDRSAESHRPDDMERKLAIQQQRDFLIAQALTTGAGAAEVRRIQELPDEEIILSGDNILPFKPRSGDSADTQAVGQ